MSDVKGVCRPRAMAGTVWLFVLFFQAHGVLYSVSTMLNESIQSENMSVWYTAAARLYLDYWVDEMTNTSLCDDDCWLSGERNCDMSSPNYTPIFCEYDHFIGASVCLDQENPPYPLEGVASECSTGPSYEIETEGDDEPFAVDLLFQHYRNGLSVAEALDDSNFYNLFSATGTFRSYNLLANLTLEDSVLGFLIFEPYSSGNMVVDGSDETVVLLVNVTRVASDGYALQFNGGTPYVFGGLNNGTGLIAFSTSMPVKLWGLLNYGIVSFTTSQDIMIMDTINAEGSLVSLTDVEASLVNITNNGTVVVNGGKYAYYGGENHGNIIVQGTGVEATFEVASNGGNVSAYEGSFDVTIGTNTGRIYAAAGVSGTLTILVSNTGTIDVPDTVTVAIASMSSEVLEQTLTVTGVSVESLSTESKVNYLEAEIASALSINQVYVDITSITGTTARVLGEWSKHRRLTTGVDITYQVSLPDDVDASSVESTMNDISDSPTGTSGTTLLASIQTASGTEGLSMVASTAVSVATTTTTDAGSTSTDNSTTTSNEWYPSSNGSTTTTSGDDFPASWSNERMRVDFALLTSVVGVAVNSNW